MLIIRVEIEDADGNLLHSYTIDHHNKQHRAVLGEQCRNAFEGDQTVITYPEPKCPDCGRLEYICERDNQC